LGHPGLFRPGFGIGGVGYTHPAGGAFSPLRAAGYIFVGKKPRHHSRRWALRLYPRKRSPLAVVFSKTRGPGTVVRVSEDPYIAGRRHGEGGLPHNSAHACLNGSRAEPPLAIPLPKPAAP